MRKNKKELETPVEKVLSLQQAGENLRNAIALNENVREKTKEEEKKEKNPP